MKPGLSTVIMNTRCCGKAVTLTREYTVPCSLFMMNGSCDRLTTQGSSDVYSLNPLKDKNNDNRLFAQSLDRMEPEHTTKDQSTGPIFMIYWKL